MSNYKITLLKHVYT